MPAVISNTSLLLYLYRIGVLEWLPTLCSDIWIPHAVVRELQEGHKKDMTCLCQGRTRGSRLLSLRRCLLNG